MDNNKATISDLEAKKLLIDEQRKIEEAFDKYERLTARQNSKKRQLNDEVGVDSVNFF